MALLVAVAISTTAPFNAIDWALMGPAVFVPWALLCACTWFHPERGSLNSTSRLIGRLPGVVRAGVRWYAAIFLAILVLVGGIVWPALSLISFFGAH